MSAAKVKDAKDEAIERRKAEIALWETRLNQSFDAIKKAGTPLKPRRAISWLESVQAIERDHKGAVEEVIASLESSSPPEALRRLQAWAEGRIKTYATKRDKGQTGLIRLLGAEATAVMSEIKGQIDDELARAEQGAEAGR